MATASDLSDVDEIRRRMAQIRRELHEDVQGVVTSAEIATDWRFYVKNYPWAMVGLACAIGYFVVPRRREVVVEAPEVPVASRKADEKKERRAGLLGTLFGLLGPVVLRAGQSYAAHFVENWIAQQGVIGPTSSPLAQGGPGPTGAPGTRPQP